MPRKPRFFLPNVPVHMIIRGNNRQAVFGEKFKEEIERSGKGVSTL